MKLKTETEWTITECTPGVARISNELGLDVTVRRMGDIENRYVPDSVLEKVKDIVHRDIYDGLATLEHVDYRDHYTTFTVAVKGNHVTLYPPPQIQLKMYRVNR